MGSSFSSPKSGMSRLESRPWPIDWDLRTRRFEYWESRDPGSRKGPDLACEWRYSLPNAPLALFLKVLTLDWTWSNF